MTTKLGPRSHRVCRERDHGRVHTTQRDWIRGSRRPDFLAVLRVSEADFAEGDAEALVDAVEVDGEVSVLSEELGWL